MVKLLPNTTSWTTCLTSIYPNSRNCNTFERNKLKFFFPFSIDKKTFL